MLYCMAFLLCLAGAFVLFLKKQYPNPSYKQASHSPNPKNWSNQKVTYTWVGHSTILINLFGYKIITDPVMFERIGVSVGKSVIVGPKRHTSPALSLEQVQDVDLILLSHAHLDHFDMPTLREIANPKTKVIVAKNTSKLLKDLSFTNVHELGWRESICLDEGVQVTAIKVRHWGARFPWNRTYGWNGYLIEYKGVRLFFAGDTAYTRSFRELQEVGPIDTAFMPIGAYSPSYESKNHCTPEEAWQMFQDSGAKWLVPIHWDTFVLSREPVGEPLQRLLQAAGNQKDRIVIREHGEVFQSSGKEKHTLDPAVV